MVAQSPVLAKDPASDAIEHAMFSTVKLWLIDADSKVLGGCSGTVIDPGGSPVAGVRIRMHSLDGGGGPDNDGTVIGVGSNHLLVHPTRSIVAFFAKVDFRPLCEKMQPDNECNQTT